MNTQSSHQCAGRPGLVLACLAVVALSAAVPALAQTTRPTAAPPVAAPLPEATLTAAQIQLMLDSPVKPMAAHDMLLLDLLKQLEGSRGRWLDLPPTTLSFLPYGEETPVSLRLPARDKTTLRTVLNTLLDPLCLEYRIIEDERGRGVLRIVPRPELLRVGRRASIDEIELLNAMRHLRITQWRTPLAAQLQQALGRPVDFQFDLCGLDAAEAYKKFNDSVVAMPPNTVAGLLDQFCLKGPWTWRVDENVVIVLDRSRQVVHQLRRHVCVRWNDVPLDQALVQLSRSAGLVAQFQPAMMEGIEQGGRRLTWQSPDEAIIQIIETLSARTGLAYEVREDSIYFFAPRSRMMTDPVIGMVNIPSRTGQYNFQVFIRKSQLPKEAQAVLDQQTRHAIDAMAKELADDGRWGKPKPIVP